MMEGVFIENDYAKISFDNGMLRGVYKNISIDLNGAKELVSDRLKISGYTLSPILVDARYVQEISKEARDYFGSEEGYELLSGAAIISDSPLSRILANFLIKVNLHKTPIPVRLFSEEKEALKWLEQYK